MRGFLVGLVLGVLIVPLALYFYFSMGMAPTGTSAGPMPFERMLAGKALHARLEHEMPGNVPIPVDEANYLEGAKVYREDCAVCHGLPEGKLSHIADGMYPKPPQLFHGKGVTDDEAGETYWKVENGIRLTGMPGFKNTLSTTQMWQVSVLLANADKIPDPVKQALLPEPVAPPMQAPGSPVATPLKK